MSDDMIQKPQNNDTSTEHVATNDKERDKLRADLGIAVEALERAAQWREGEVVDTHFDSPWAATLAREALAKIRGEK